MFHPPSRVLGPLTLSFHFSSIEVIFHTLGFNYYQYPDNLHIYNLHHKFSFKLRPCAQQCSCGALGFLKRTSNSAYLKMRHIFTFWITHFKLVTIWFSFRNPYIWMELLSIFVNKFYLDICIICIHLTHFLIY